MGKIENFMLRCVHTGVGPSEEKHNNDNTTIPIKSSQNDKNMLATVMMTSFTNPNVQSKFNRLLQIEADGRISGAYALNRKRISIGRSHDNHVCIDDPLVSVKHMTISLSDDTCVVSDHNSSNGTFVEGEPLDGARVLKDGDEIILGNTILRFAARQSQQPVQSDLTPEDINLTPERRNRSAKRRNANIWAGAIGLLMSIIFLFAVVHYTLGPIYTWEPTVTEEKNTSAVAPPAPEETPPSPSPEKDDQTTDSPKLQPSRVPEALDHYAEGRLETALDVLRSIITAKSETKEINQAKTMQSMVIAIQQLHYEALQAQAKKKLSKALNCWDRLLKIDMELVGDRPSFYAAQAEEEVQNLSYEHALDAFKKKNHERARQLCHVILQLNPDHQEALALLARMAK